MCNVNVPNVTLILLKCYIILCVSYNDLKIKEKKKDKREPLRVLYQYENREPGTVAHGCDSSNWEAEVGGLGI